MKIIKYSTGEIGVGFFKIAFIIHSRFTFHGLMEFDRYKIIRIGFISIWVFKNNFKYAMQ